MFKSFSIPDLEYIDLYNENHMYWVTADMYFKANQMGILDPETYTQKNEDYSQKINEGQVLYSSMEWDFDAGNAELNKNGGTDKYVDVPWADTAEFPAWFPEPPNSVWQQERLLSHLNAMKQN